MPAGGARGVTLIELMVTVAILALMILAVGMIITNSRDLVAASQTMIRGNATAAAIAELIRRDLSRLSQGGFLCIDTEDDGEPVLLFITAGPTPSLRGQETGNGGLIAYGLARDTDENGVLWRMGYVLNRDDRSSQDDSHPSDMGWWQSLAAADVKAVFDDFDDGSFGGARDPGSFPVPVDDQFENPPRTLSNIESHLWKFLAEHCSHLEITWTDGEKPDGRNLKWYGRKWDEDQDRYVTDPKPDEQSFEREGDEYRALWTNDIQSDWPLAIRVRFKLGGENMPDELDKLDYEVICPVGQ